MAFMSLAMVVDYLFVFISKYVSNSSNISKVFWRLVWCFANQVEMNILLVV